MSNNIFKFHQVVVQNNEKLMIDNNGGVAKRLEFLEEQRYQEQLQQKHQKDEDGFVGGLDTQHLEALVSEEEIVPEQTREEAMQVVTSQVQEMLDEAKRDSEALKAQAIDEIEILKRSLFEEAKQDGYTAGYSEGMAQIEEQKNSLRAEELRLEKEYQQVMNELEPKFIQTLTEIYEHVFQIDLKKERSIVAHLLSSAMHKIDGNGSYLIHVSKEDYPYVTMKKQEILAGTAAANASLEIIEDMTLGANDCIIETDGGVFDCGLGTQLEELAQKLKLLSFVKAQ